MPCSGINRTQIRILGEESVGHTRFEKRIKYYNVILYLESEGERLQQRSRQTRFTEMGVQLFFHVPCTLQHLCLSFSS